MGSGGRVRDLPRRGRGANRPDVSRRVAAVAAWGAVDGRLGEVQGVRLRSSARRALCSRGQTPASVHWAGRRQQVIPEPKPSYCGRRSQAIPVCRTNRMPWNTSRSGYLLRPGCKRRRPENLRRAAPGVTNAPRAPLPTRASQKAKARPLEEPVPAGVSGTTPRRIAPPARMPWSLCPLPGLQHRRRERRRLRPGSVEFRTGCTAASGVGTRRQAHRQRGRSRRGVGHNGVVGPAGSQPTWPSRTRPSVRRSAIFKIADFLRHPQQPVKRQILQWGINKDAPPIPALLRQMDPLRSRPELEGDRVDHLMAVPPAATPLRRLARK